jgi:hypothetical protein
MIVSIVKAHFEDNQNAKIARVCDVLCGGKSAAGKASSQVSKLKSRFGISKAEYDRLYAKQGGLCAICENSKEANTQGHSLSIDHCHKTGRIRALLCKPCNLAIGNLKDSPELCERAAQYLRAA